MDISEFMPPLAATGWRVYRIVASRFPPVSIFDRVANAADLAASFAVEAMTNDRLREEAGNLSLVPVEDRVSGPGTTPIMAAFTHLNPNGGRFSDASYGAYYAAPVLDTAIAETRYHNERFLALTDEPPIEIDVRVYAAHLEGELHNIESCRNTYPALYDPDSYVISQGFGRHLRETGSNGIIYGSVRHPGEICVAVFRPRLLTGCHQAKHLTYCWDGTLITRVYEKKDLD